MVQKKINLMCLFMCACGCVGASVPASSLQHWLIKSTNTVQASNNKVLGETAIPDKLQLTVKPRALTNVY